MYNTMVKLRNKKAFTLVEMMAVIAIVAVLVAVVVPIIGNSTTKARAATNAANLRSVEGQLSTARVSDPDLFITVTDEFGQFVTQLDQFKNLVGSIDLTGGFGWVLEKLGVDASTKLSAYKMCHFTDDDKDGVIEIATRDGEHSYTLNNVPLSVAVNAGGTPGMTVLEGTPMTIWISENGFVATYETTGGAYVSANFAEVAETGEFNSTPSGGDTLVELECASGHVGPFTNLGDSGHRCEHCGTTLGHDWPTIVDTDGDGICKADGCDYACKHTGDFGNLLIYKVGTGWCHQCETCKKFVLYEKNDSGNTPDHTCADGDNDCKCDICKAQLDHTDSDKNCVCDVCKASLDHVDVSPKDHYCDVCKYEMSSHYWVLGHCNYCGTDCTHSSKTYTAYGSLGHKGTCSVCGSITQASYEAHSYDSNGKCTVCGYWNHTHNDTDGDGVCDMTYCNEKWTACTCTEYSYNYKKGSCGCDHISNHHEKTDKFSFGKCNAKIWTDGSVTK